MAFMLVKYLVFLDSFQFMSQSLDKLSSNLPDDQFKYTSEVFKDEKLRLIKQKGVYSIHMIICINGKNLITNKRRIL